MCACGAGRPCAGESLELMTVRCGEMRRDCGGWESAVRRRARKNDFNSQHTSHFDDGIFGDSNVTLTDLVKAEGLVERDEMGVA